MSSSISYHIEKHKKGVVNKLQRHNERKPGQKHRNENIDDEKTALNIFIKTGSDSYQKRIDEQIDQRYRGKRKPRSDAVYLVSQTVQFGGYLQKLDINKQTEVLKSAYDWLASEFEEKNVISAVIHLDETNPHLHLDLIPLTQDGRLSAKEIFDKQRLIKVQKELLEHVQKKFPDYEFERADKRKRPFSNGKTQEEFEIMAEKERKILALSKQAFEVKKRNERISFQNKTVAERNKRISIQNKTVAERNALKNEKLVSASRKFKSAVVRFRNDKKRFDLDKQKLNEEKKKLSFERQEFNVLKNNAIELINSMVEQAKTSIFARREYKKVIEKYDPIDERNIDEFVSDALHSIDKIEDIHRVQKQEKVHDKNVIDIDTLLEEKSNKVEFGGI